MTSSDTQIEVLENLEAAINYRKWCLSLALEVAGKRPFELGSGLGIYAEEIISSEKFQVEAITLSELDKNSLKILRRKFFGEPRVTIVDAANIQYIGDQTHTSYISWNVLEHIEDDVAALEFSRRVCIPGGSIMMLVPAHQHLYSRFDAKVGHFRRYSKKELLLKANEAGLVDIRISHFNFAGYFFWLLKMKILRQSPEDHLALRILDRIVIPRLMQLERYVRPPFGQSLVLFARTPFE